MILTAKPWVRRTPTGRWLVWVRHSTGIHTETWPHRVPAMNCALAIARTAEWDWELVKLHLPKEPR